MTLFLEVIRYAEEAVDFNLSATISSAGGSIGRSVGNSLILPDTEGFVSRIHVKIECNQGVFFITDCSSNGTFLLEPIPEDPENAFNEVFINEDKRELLDGGFILIGGFEIVVQYREDYNEASDNINVTEPFKVDTTLPRKKALSEQVSIKPIFAEPAAPETNSDAFVSNVLHDVPAVQASFSIPDAIEPPDPADDIPDEFDIDDFFANDKPLDQPEIPGVEEDDSLFVGLQNSFANDADLETGTNSKKVPSTASSIVTTPVYSEAENIRRADVNRENLPPVVKKTNPVVQQSQARKATVAPVRRQVAHKTSINDGFFEALGLDASKLPDDEQALERLMQESGHMLRLLLEANISLLKARSDIKKEFSMSLTVVQKEENNPLKFCQSLDEAIPYLFYEQFPGFLSKCQAVDESVNDLFTHQLSMMAGIQAGLKGSLNKFNPAIVEKKCAAGGFSKSSKNWDYFKSHFNKMAKEALADFFGSDFAKAYERQVHAMKNKR